jgi:hypothetical protein
MRNVTIGMDLGDKKHVITIRDGFRRQKTRYNNLG